MALFLAMETQWLRGGLGERVGLNYAMIEPTASLLEIRLDPRPRMMLDLQTMERAALGCWAEQRAREAKDRR